jgi:hypothetical protein
VPENPKPQKKKPDRKVGLLDDPKIDGAGFKPEAKSAQA